MSPALNVQRYGTLKAAVEIHDRITVDFYMGLPHIKPRVFMGGAAYKFAKISSFESTFCI